MATPIVFLNVIPHEGFPKIVRYVGNETLVSREKTFRLIGSLDKTHLKQIENIAVKTNAIYLENRQGLSFPSIIDERDIRIYSSCYLPEEAYSSKPSREIQLMRDAFQGNPWAEYDLGLLIEREHLRKAMILFHRAARQGHLQAYAKLGLIYATVPMYRSPKTSFHYYQKGALAGDAICQQMLGMKYLWGDGVSRDLNKAEEWYEKAAEEGSKLSKLMLESLKNKKNLL